MKNPIPSVDVAHMKGCSRQAVVNAVERGGLTGRKVGKVWLVEDDAKLATWQVRETGGRAHGRNRSAAAPEEAGP